MKLRGRPSGAAAVLAVCLSRCVVSRGLKVEPLTPAGVAKEEITSPVKVHLRDGSTVVFSKGVTVAGRRLVGRGTHYDLALGSARAVTSVPLDDVLAMENFSVDEDTFTSLALTLGLVGAVLANSGALFGSCPTVYSDPGGAHGRPARLEAELFSYSIAPLFENRDLQRLAAKVGTDGRLVLEIRNEALETHYINHLELLEVRHRPLDEVLPDPHGRLLRVSGRAPPGRATTRAGADVRRTLSGADGQALRTDRRTLAAAHDGDLADWVDLTFPAPPETGERALVLRARNSLLNTVLFYDVMLAEAGPRAVDWLGRDLDRVSSAVELGRFAREYMGLRVAVWTGTRFEEVARVPDPGPIAWHDVAVPLPPTPGQRTLRLRLTFLADGWRIDSAGLGVVRSRPVPRVLPVAGVTGPTGQPEPAALRSLASPDHDYLRTSPGQRFFVRFDPAPLAPGERRTFLLLAQGYYREWIRGDWLRSPHPPRVFAPSEGAVLEAFARWRREQQSMEARFEKQRVPVLQGGR